VRTAESLHASSEFFTFDPMFDFMNSIVSGVSSVVGSAEGPLITVLRVMKQDKNCLSSPMTIIYEAMGQSSWNLYSIGSGATFSPPAVMISSLILPVITKKPSSSNFPRSPE